ncbi:MAG TPA: efflux RND transporter permease subunit, partial [Pirellulales bacterium]|nr:efflux RND transporter permease subunit [Pirellulales bacterium]
LFVPLSLAVGFSMIASYLLSSTFVPVASTWLLRHVRPTDAAGQGWTSFERIRLAYAGLMKRLVACRWPLALGYLLAASLIIVLVGSRLGIEIFPLIDAGEFRLRIRAPDGTHIEQTEKYTREVLKAIENEVGAGSIELTLAYVGSIPSTYPINAVYQWSRGPEEAFVRIALVPKSGIRVEELKETLREKLKRQLPQLRLSFEPADIVNEVMSFGSPTPIDVAVSGKNMADLRAFNERLRGELETIPALRDLQVAQSLDYPTVEVQLDRQKAGMAGIAPAQVVRSVLAATTSSRFVVPIFWPDPKSGIGYLVQVQIPQAQTRSKSDLENVPIKRNGNKQLLLRDVAEVREGTMPGQFDRYNMARQVSLTANFYGSDLGRVSRQVSQAVERAGEPPLGAKVEVRGQIPPLRDMLTGLGIGFGIAVVVIFLLLSANFQAPRLALVTVSTAPAVVAGVALALWLTGTTLNIQSFIGAIMAIGVAMANGILLVTFAEQHRRERNDAVAAAIEGAASRLRPILMTSLAMTAGMVPMALGLGEGGEQVAPLGRAVIGGLAAATFATLVVLPAVFAIVQRGAGTHSASLDPDDPQSVHFAPPTATGQY